MKIIAYVLFIASVSLTAQNNNQDILNKRKDSIYQMVGKFIQLQNDNQTTFDRSKFETLLSQNCIIEGDLGVLERDTFIDQFENSYTRRKKNRFKYTIKNMIYDDVCLGAVVELDYDYWVGNDKRNTRTVMLFKISNNRIHKIVMPWRID